MCTFPNEELHLSEMAEPLVSSEQDEEEEQLSLFDVNWDDILLPRMACYLTIKELFELRCCSQLARRFAETALEKRKEINFSGNNHCQIKLAFGVLGRCCRRLESLQLAKCHWLTDDILLPILTDNLLTLRIVNLNECINLTAQSLQPIIIGCRDLRVLKLSKCQWLTTGAVDALTLHQSKLVEFDISHCLSIGERCLIIFFRKLNKLKILSLANTPSVTDQVLIQIGNFCHELEHINLIGCAAITDYGIHSFTQSCSKLQSMMVQHCPQLTERVLAPLRNRLHIDRPSMGYNLPMIMNQLYLQV